MNEQLAAFKKVWQSKTEVALKTYMSEINAPQSLIQAMEYSLLAGGKRIRPIFLFATMDALGQDPEQGLEIASAVELIHTYSLIHDDLPAMDDDDYRRGKLTNHKVYGEAMAILAGDGLLTHAFFLLAQGLKKTRSSYLVEMLEELSLFTGPSGMVGGQAADILGENKALSLEELYYIHEHKTADLLTCSVRLGGYLAGANSVQLEQLTRYAKHIGLAFQIQDDILDEVGDEAKLGKSVGSDKDNDKNTFISLLGLSGSQEALQQHVQKSKDALEQLDIKRELLSALADYMIQRDN